MDKIFFGRRDWLKLGGLGSAATILPAQAQALATRSKKVRGVVFMVSDGMSQGVLTMAENFSQKIRGKSTRWWELIADPASISGLMETSSASSYVTDSAAASSAWGGGVKVNNGSINVRPNGEVSVPIFQKLKKNGNYKTGLVTTAKITHATPAGFAAVTEKRDNEHLIAPQYKDVVDVLLGGGKMFFDAEKRIDKRDEIKPYLDAGYKYIQNRVGLQQAKMERVLGLFSDDHMPFEIDRQNLPGMSEEVPSLAEMAEFALSNFLSGDTKFLLQIEGARIDHAAHGNDAAALIWDQLAFDDALRKVMELIQNQDDVLVIVTSDHGNANPGLNGMGSEYGASNTSFEKLVGMKSSYENLLGEWLKIETKTAPSLGKLIKERLGISLTRNEFNAVFEAVASGVITEWNEQMATPHGLLGQMLGNHTGIGWSGNSHTSDPTMISAIGPQAERFSGIVLNHQVYDHLLEILA